MLTLHQTWLLTGIALGAGLLSSVAFGLMTLPITRSMKGLVEFADSVAKLSFQNEVVIDTGPTELRHLADSLKQMGQRLSTSFEQLERMELTRRELIANVSHDLRTPLASIQSYVEAMQDKVVTDPHEIADYLHTVHTETRRVSSLINDLFELSKLEAGQEVLNATLTHIDQILVESLDGHRMQLREKGIHVSVDMPDALPTICISAEKIHRVVSNLIENAIRYSPDRSVIQVFVRPLSAGSHDHLQVGAIEVSIQDVGPGVQPADAERLFERFYRADRSRTRGSGGAGLGLAIAKGLVQLHGGSIGVRNRVDGRSGAVFWFTLPLGLTQEGGSDILGKLPAQ